MIHFTVPFQVTDRRSPKERHKHTKIAKIADTCKPLFLPESHLQEQPDFDFPTAAHATSELRLNYFYYFWELCAQGLQRNF